MFGDVLWLTGTRDLIRGTNRFRMIYPKGAHKMNRYISYACSVLLLLCLIDMPYWFYKVAGIAACLTCVLRALEEYQISNKASILAVLFGFCALLFNPFVTPKLGRTAWNIVDVALASLLIIPYIVPGLRSRGSRFR